MFPLHVLELGGLPCPIKRANGQNHFSSSSGPALTSYCIDINFKQLIKWLFLPSQSYLGVWWSRRTTTMQCMKCDTQCLKIYNNGHEKYWKGAQSKHNLVHAWLSCPKIKGSGAKLCIIITPRSPNFIWLYGRQRSQKLICNLLTASKLFVKIWHVLCSYLEWLMMMRSLAERSTLTI